MLLIEEKDKVHQRVTGAKRKKMIREFPLEYRTRHDEGREKSDLVGASGDFNACNHSIVKQ